MRRFKLKCVKPVYLRPSLHYYCIYWHRRRARNICHNQTSAGFYTVVAIRQILLKHRLALDCLSRIYYISIEY